MDKRSVSRPCQWLIQQCQDINFGSITFYVSGGAPDLIRKYRIVRTMKLSGGQNGPRPESGIPNFELRKEHTALLARLARLADGTRVTVKVMHGLPTNSIDIEEEHQAA